MANALVDPTILFRFEFPIARRSIKWSDRGLKLPQPYRVPSFDALAERRTFADIRMAWSDQGIAVHVNVQGKRQTPWCRHSRCDDSDGFHLWVDTRCSPGIHRATKYCHHFVFMPCGGGLRHDQPFADLLPIPRARSHPRGIGEQKLMIAAFPRHDGYELSGFIPSESMTGYDPDQQPRLAIFFAVADRELGWQSLSLGPEFPVTEDPSLWGEATLIESLQVGDADKKPPSTPPAS